MTRLSEALKAVEQTFDDSFATKLARLEAAIKDVEPLIPSDDSRYELLAALAALPDEAYEWIVGAALTQIWPDGLGGFMPESRTAITNVRAAAKAWAER